MNTTAQVCDTSDPGYAINYAHAPWIIREKTVGIFMSLGLASDQDEIVSTEFKQTSGGTDFFIIGIMRGVNGTPRPRHLGLHSYMPGIDTEGTRSDKIEFSLIDVLTQEPLLKQSLLLPYGYGAYIPEPEPSGMYMYNYLSAPFAIYTGPGQTNNAAYIIVNTFALENDVFEGDFTPAPDQKTSDTFNLNIHSTNSGTPFFYSKVFGPYLISSPESELRVSTSVNGNQVQRPIGIKSYGNESKYLLL